jgi:hypothetical protein
MFSYFESILIEKLLKEFIRLIIETLYSSHDYLVG